MKRLYIGGLGHTITQKDLKDRFGKFGNVHDVELVTRKDDAGVPFKTFGYINLEISDVDFKRCLTVLNNSKWKGGTLQIEAARESFLQRLNQERHEASEQKMEAPPVDQKQRMIESLREAGVEGFHMKAAVPGTEVPGHKDWVVSKFGRVLPILNLKSRGRNKTVKCDPSKHSHNIKRLDGSVDAADLVSVSQLTWELQGGDDDISRKRRGEFPPQKPRPKKARAETSICAAAQSNSSAEKTPLSNGKTRPADTRTQTPGTNTAPQRPEGVCVFDSDEEIRMQAAQHQTSQSALVQEEEMDDLEVVGDDYGDDYSRKQQSRGRVPTCPALTNKEDEDEEEDYDSADTDEILASHKTPMCVPVERHPSGLNSEGRSRHTAPSNPGSSGGEKQQKPVSLSAVDTSKARNKTPVPKAKPPSPSELVSSEEEEEEEDEDDSEDEYEAMFSNCVRLEVSLSDLQLLAEEARLSDRQGRVQSPPPPSHSAKKGTTPEEILASIMGDDSSGDESSGNRQKKKKKKRKTKEGLSTALPAFQGTKALMEELPKAGAGLKRRNQEEEERVGGSGEEERAGGSCKKHKAAVTSPRHGGNASSESSEEEEKEEEEIIAPIALLPQVSQQLLKTPVCTVASSSSSDSSSSADEEEMITPTALAPTVTKQTPICTAASSSSSDSSSSAEEEEEEEEMMAPKMTKQPSSSSSSDSSSSEEEEEAFVITNTGEGYPLQEVAKLSAPSSSSDEESEEEEVSPDKELKRKDKLGSKAPSSSSSSSEEEEEEVVSVSSRKPPSAVGMLDSHRQQQDNQRRLAAMEQRHREAESQRKLIQGALSERDASVPSTGKSKHIVFGSDEEAEDDFIQTPTPRKVLFQDSQSEGEESHSKMASTNQKAAIKEKNTRKLFENCDDEEEGDETDEDEQRFQLKPQFEGQSGQKLMKLQSRFGTDRRFQMDSRFLESDGEEEEEEGEREEGPEKAKEGEEELEEEKKRSLDILQSMLNIQPSDAKPASKGKAFRDVSALHYDPSKEEHAAFETKTEEKKKESKQERRKKREEAVKLPEVSKEIFYNVSVDLKSVFGPAEEQSAPEEKTATPWDEEEGDEEGGRGVVEQASLPSFLSADSGAVTQQPTGGFSFSFFGDDSATGSAVEKDQYKVETIRGPKVSWQADPRFQDSSSEEEEQEEQQEEGKKPAEKLTPQRKAFFFFLEDDERLREGPGLFCRTSTLDDQRGDWQERRPALIQEYRKKHKDAKRKLRGSNRK